MTTSPVYQHYCPYLATVADVQGVVLAAHDLLVGVADQVGGAAVTDQLVLLRKTLQRHVSNLSMLDPAQPASSIGAARGAMCEAVQLAWSEASPRFADPRVLPLLEEFLRTNEAARKLATPVAPRRRRDGLAVACASLGVAGAAALLVWAVSRAGHRKVRSWRT